MKQVVVRGTINPTMSYKRIWFGEADTVTVLQPNGALVIEQRNPFRMTTFASGIWQSVEVAEETD